MSKSTDRAAVIWAHRRLDCYLTSNEERLGVRRGDIQKIRTRCSVSLLFDHFSRPPLRHLAHAQSICTGIFYGVVSYIHLNLVRAALQRAILYHLGGGLHGSRGLLVARSSRGNCGISASRGSTWVPQPLDIPSCFCMLRKR